MPRGHPKLNPSVRARARTITSVSGDRVENIDDAANQTTAHPANPSGAAMSA